MRFRPRRHQRRRGDRPGFRIVTSWSTRLSGGGTTTGTLRVAHDPAAPRRAHRSSPSPMRAPPPRSRYLWTARSRPSRPDCRSSRGPDQIQLVGVKRSTPPPRDRSSRKLRVYRGSGDGTSPAGSLAAVDVTGAEPPLRATYEADADHDGFGDETQDQCASDATTQGPCAVPGITAPETTISRGRRRRRPPSQAGLPLQFSSNEGLADLRMLARRCAVQGLHVPGHGEGQEAGQAQLPGSGPRRGWERRPDRGATPGRSRRSAEHHH